MLVLSALISLVHVLQTLHQLEVQLQLESLVLEWVLHRRGWSLHIATHHHHQRWTTLPVVGVDVIERTLIDHRGALRRGLQK